MEHCKPPIYTGMAFVTFVRPETQNQFLVDFARGGDKCDKKYQDGHYSRLASMLNVGQWHVQQAPDNKDIRWENLHVGRTELMVRQFSMNVLLLAFLFFFTTPITFFNKLHDLVRLGDLTNNGTVLTPNASIVEYHANKTANVYSSAREHDMNSTGALSAARTNEPGMSMLQDLATLGDGWPAFVRAAVFDYLPSLIIVSLNLCLLALMEIPARSFEKKHLHSEIERSIGWRTFIFLLINMLILPSLAMDAASTFVFDLVNDSNTGDSMLDSMSAGDHSAYFATIVLQAAFVSSPYQLLRLHEYLIGLLGWLIATTPEGKCKAMEPWTHEYGYHLGNAMLIFSIGLCFSVTAPVLLPMTLTYFCIRHCVDKYNLLYVRPHALMKNSCTFASTIESFLVVSLLVFQTTTTVILMRRTGWSTGENATFSTYMLLFLCLVLLVCTFLFYVGILHRAVCRSSDDWILTSSFERIAEAGEKLRISLMDGLDRGVLRKIAGSVEKARSSVEKVAKNSIEKVVRRLSRRNLLDPEDELNVKKSGGGTGSKRSERLVYSKELGRWIDVETSRCITIDEAGTPHKLRSPANPNVTHGSGGVRSGMDSVMRRLKFGQSGLSSTRVGTPRGGKPGAQFLPPGKLRSMPALGLLSPESKANATNSANTTPILLGDESVTEQVAIPVDMEIEKVNAGTRQKSTVTAANQNETIGLNLAGLGGLDTPDESSVRFSPRVRYTPRPRKLSLIMHNHLSPADLASNGTPRLMLPTPEKCVSPAMTDTTYCDENCSKLDQNIIDEHISPPGCALVQLSENLSNSDRRASSGGSLSGGGPCLNTTPASTLKRRHQSLHKETSPATTAAASHNDLSLCSVSEVVSTDIPDGMARLDDSLPRHLRILSSGGSGGKTLSQRTHSAFVKLVTTIRLREPSVRTPLADSPTAAVIFEQIDAEHSGQIGREALRQLAAKLGLEISSAEIDSVIECMVRPLSEVTCAR
jgi:hypothetical protein